MRILVIDNGTRYWERLLNMLRGHVISVTEFGSIASTVSADLVVLSGGSRVSAYSTIEAFSSELAFIRTTDIPLIGICLGFELLARAYGAVLEEMPASEKGVLEIFPVRSDAIFEQGTAFTVYENHRVVVREVPTELLALARSKDGIEVIRHKTKPQYGFQFHPEMFTDTVAGEAVFWRAVRHVCPQATDVNTYS